MTEASHSSGHERSYRPIGEYAVIGDTLTAALVSRSGSIDWLCLPRFDDGAIFSALLDAERGGFFSVGPAAPARTTRRYLDNSCVLVTRHEAEDGVLEVTDFLSLPPGNNGTGPRAQREDIRRVRALAGAPCLSVRIAPRPRYGVIKKIRRHTDHLWSINSSKESVYLHGDFPLARGAAATLEGTARLTAGQAGDIVLNYTHGAINVLPAASAQIDRKAEQATRYWQGYAGKVSYDGPFQKQVVRSALVLRMLTFSTSGAVLAAVTMGLPEAVGGSRNWDYRYCWLRDASFIMHGFASLGLRQEGDAFFRWLMHATQLSAPRLRPVYDVHGRTDLDASPLRNHEGYRQSGPVRRGNDATFQLQLDAYGSVLQAALVFAQSGGKLSRSELHRLAGFARTVCDVWTLPDNGLWEQPDPRRHHTYSKVMCWAALDAFIKLGEQGLHDHELEHFRRERAAIRESVLARAWNEHKQAFTGAYDADWLDASTLLLPRLGFLDANDPRMVGTYQAIEESLAHGPHLRRYPHGVDGFASREGCFTACGYWAADYLARRGDIQAAEQRVGDLLRSANDLGLMSEETDSETGAMLGNFPQGFSHAALIGAALAIEENRDKTS